MKKYNRTLLVALLIAAVFATAIGGTFAWFTDEVTSTSNIIKTGTLDIGMNYATEYAGEETAWKDASSAAIFDHKLWEPGYTQVRYVQIKNLGDLAFKFQVNVKPTAILGSLEYNESNPLDSVFTPAKPAPEYPLEEVIDVYIAPAKAYASFEDLKAKAGDPLTIKELIEDADGAAYGQMLPGDAPIELCIALHMQESAGNEYQNASVADGFAIQVQAAQLTHEEDSFGDQYDADATYANLPSAVVIKLDEKAIAEESGVPLQTAYMFRTTDTPDPANNPELLDSPYFYWHADYVVTFDNDMTAGTFSLAGQYDLWGEQWVDINSSYLENILDRNVIKKGEEIRLLGEVGKVFNGGEPIYVNYAELCAGIQQFDCGAYNTSTQNIGKTMTVELRIYETEEPSDENGNSHNVETGRYVTIGSFTYTFDSVVE